MPNKLFKINPNDNVAVALTEINAGEIATFSGGSLKILEHIPKNFKAALTNIKKGEKVIKYGYPIGETTTDISAGMVVHTHNLKSALTGRKNYNINQESTKKTQNPDCGTFKGFLRKNGKVGIRNEIYIIPTVGCVNEVCGKIAEKAIAETGKKDIFVFKHPYGCSQLGGDQENTQKILASLARHPNAGGALIVSLGCENNNLKEFMPFLENYDKERVMFLTAQESEDEILEGTEIVKNLTKLCQADKRVDVPISKLVVGLKCGGSDALSGITADPLVGRVCDMLSACGCGVILTEVPEMFGAEHLLMERSAKKEVYDNIINMVNTFKDYYISHGESVGENPSPGNKEGGITTLEEKSLGCVQKGGTSEVKGIIKYGEAINKSGLHLLNGPGNDIVAQTALSAAGAHIILFTTGRGTPLGATVPTIKISTNSALALKKSNWIDFDAGKLLSGKSMEELSAKLMQLLINIADGSQTKNEINGYREIAIWKNGVTL